LLPRLLRLADQALIGKALPYDLAHDGLEPASVAILISAFIEPKSLGVGPIFETTS